ncbi:hypothetical protein [Corynebacterium marinum]|jgi:hypothetical protein|uniref:Uncharacterized protein n=1 Tax=Corynebacterium marinum DSM 44953 TaxID=1224162 RepID=A0A0B6TGS2_9CORY|nr:hypothetical protein [Corynebacterium marinum]AJK69177.1 hypothetical protein B840_07895 [Corynebacterium marinum DSM 44953]GGO17303.1 hypothetical protein GCM10010980_14420 [Corynebacterium marinum]
MPRVISTDLNLLIRPADWDRVAAGLPAALAEAGYHADSVHGEIVDLTCEPDNMLVTQFSRQEGHQPVVEALHRIVINGSSELDLRAATQAVVGKLPANTYWYGTSMEGPTEPGISASCAWQHP